MSLPAAKSESPISIEAEDADLYEEYKKGSKNSPDKQITEWHLVESSTESSSSSSSSDEVVNDEVDGEDHDPKSDDWERYEEENVEEEDEVEKPPVKRVRNPEMFHTRLAFTKENLPQYPSWEVFNVAPGWKYSHSEGVSYHLQPGFLRGRVFLMPFTDSIDIVEEHRFRSKVPQGRGRQITEAPTYTFIRPGRITIKFFMSFDYECSEGHRFFHVSDKSLHEHEVTEDELRELAEKFTRSGAPLFRRCPCRPRNAAQFVAQLTRIHLITPSRHPVRFHVRPRILVQPFAMAFAPAVDDEIVLPKNAYCVIKMPRYYLPNSVGYQALGKPCDKVSPETELPDAKLAADFYKIVEYREVV